MERTREGAAGSRLVALGVYTSVPLALVCFWWIQRIGLLAPTPYWVIAIILAVTAAANLATNSWLAAAPDSRWRLHARIAASALTTAAVLHATGWGSILAIGYALGAAELLDVAGARSWRPALVWNLVAIALGEAAVAAEIAPTLLEPRLAHFAAALGALCLVLVGQILGRTAEHAERAEQEVRESEEHFRSLVQHAADVIMVVDADGTIRYASPAVRRLLGVDAGDCEGGSVAEWLKAGSVDRALELFASVASTPGRSVMFDAVFVHRGGEDRIVEITVTGRDSGHGPGVVANLHDLTEQRLLEEKLLWDAGHDALTGLWNRAALAANLGQACERAAREGRRIGLLFVDLDGFKAVNDTLGHEIGDAALVESAFRLRSAVRAGDTVARLGGDEFTVLLEQIDDAAAAIEIADRVLAAFEEPWGPILGDLALSASVGVAVGDASCTSADELLRRADAAMYRAKRAGRARWAVAAG